MNLSIRPMDVAAAHEAVTWRYAPPYDIYNVSNGIDDELVAFFTDESNGYYRIDDDLGLLAAFCCFGADGQVPGGDYHAPALDIGLGVRPDLTGQGYGKLFVAAVCDFAQYSFGPPALRVTIATWNERAQRVWQQAGFVPTSRFSAMRNQFAFIVLVRSV